MSAMRKTLVACVAVLLVPAVAPAQEVIKEISTQRLENILSGMGLTYKKIDGKNGVFFYDYNSKNLILRLTNFQGKDLMIDVLLPAIDWKEVNKWNMQAKFSRASLRKDANQVDSLALESNLDLLGGVTEETIKHFIRGFDLEIVNYDKFAKGGGAAVAQEEVYKGIPNAKLEKILTDMKLNFKKGKGGGQNTFFYDYSKNNFQIRVTNFSEEDLMIDAVFPASDVAKVNAWNVKRSFIRAVLYPGNGMPYTSLESNLDCMGGTSDSIVRYFINAFDGDVKDFAKYLEGK
jgi:hypothetical protein